MSYYEVCPKCGSDLIDYCDYDIVTAQRCSNEKCDFYKDYGTAVLYDGETYLEPYDEEYEAYHDYDMYEEEENGEETEEKKYITR